MATKRIREIDRETIEVVKNGYYQSYFKKNLGMWEKGEVVYEYRGVNSYRYDER